MAAALPVTKIAALLVKTLAKPVSKRIKHEFSKNQTTASVLVGVGQVSHQITSRLTIWSAGYKVRDIKPLELDDALKVGSEFIGEFFILSVSVVAVVWEYNRSKEKERVKEDKQNALEAAERYELQQKLNALDVRLIALERVVQTQNDSIFHLLSSKRPKYVPPTDVVPIDTTNANKTPNTTNNSNNNDNNNHDNNKNNNNHQSATTSTNDESTTEIIITSQTSNQNSSNNSSWWRWILSPFTNTASSSSSSSSSTSSSQPQQEERQQQHDEQSSSNKT